MEKLGKYGVKVKKSLEEKYPFRFQELIMDGSIMEKLLEREKEIIQKKAIIEENLKKQYPKPEDDNFLHLARYNIMIEQMIDEFLQEEIEEKI